MEKEFPQRKNTRLQNYDYSSRGAYFITICTETRRQILSKITVGGDVLDAPKHDVHDIPKNSQYSNSVFLELSPYGKVADKYINQLSEFYNYIKVDSYVIMPNHIHILMFVIAGGASGTSPPTTKQHSIVSQFVSTFKRFCNKEIGFNIWQRYFYDHIVRNQENYDNHLKYIYGNPSRWRYDELYTEK